MIIILLFLSLLIGGVAMATRKFGGNYDEQSTSTHVWDSFSGDELAGSPVVFFEANHKGDLLYGSEQIASALGSTISKGKKYRFSNLVIKAQQVAFHKMWQQVLEEQPVTSRELCLSDGESAPHHFWCSLYPVKDKNGKVVRVRGMLGDLSSEKSLSYALEAAEERFSVLFRESSDPNLIISMSGEILLVNPAFENIVGFHSSDVFSGGKSWQDFVFSEDVDNLLTTITTCAETEADQTCEFRIKKSDDELAWFEQCHSILHDENNRPRGILAVARDITLHKDRELQLLKEADDIQRRHNRAQELVKKLTMLFAESGEEPFNLDGFLHGICDFLANVYEPALIQLELFKHDRNLLYSKAEQFKDLIEQNNNTLLCRFCNEKVKKGGPLYIRNIRDTEFWEDEEIIREHGVVAYLGAPLRNSAGVVYGSLSIVNVKNRDFDDTDIELITVAALHIAARLRYEAQEEIKRELEQHLRESQKMEAIGMLAGGIAHDFNNMLGSILGFSSHLISLFGEDPRLGRQLGLIQQSAEQAADLTRQLLSFSKSTNPDKAPVQLTEIIEGVLKILRHSFAKNLIIETDLAMGLPNVLGDRSQIDQIIMNLCMNAVEAMHENGGKLRVVTQSRKLTNRERAVLANAGEGEYVCLKVIDEGVGIKKEIQQHIFEPFFTTKSDSGGTGMGLSIVYGIVNGHGGDIIVRSEGKGTEFCVFLPAHEGEVHIRKHEELEASGGDECILVVEDEECVREMVCDILRVNGYSLLSADSGITALELQLQNKGEIGLVLLDMVMPGMDGVATFKALREVNPSLPVLLTTGYSEGGNCSDLINQGARGLIRKPYTSQTLLREIRRAVTINA